MEREQIFRTLGLVVLGAPVCLFAVLGLTSLFRRHPLSERSIARLTQFTIAIGLIASIALLGLMLSWNSQHVPIELGSWVEMEVDQFPGGHHDHYHFVFKFLFDRLSIPFVILTFVLCGTVAAFANRYMHRDQGFNRFFLLFSLFVVGMVTTSLAGTIETLFSGWELVGLSSALLVAFFHERPNPVKNGLYVWIIYRISDAALLLAAIAMHHMQGEGDFDQVMIGQWPDCDTAMSANAAIFVGLLLIVAAMGKSAMVPFSGWLPRAMEGPTPSSAVFYGALSVHLGAFLLLRFSPIVYRSPTLQVAVVIVGLGTAIVATFLAEVQTDIKSALSFASLAQVGIIFAEIAVGFRYLAIIHIVGHGCLRTLQFLRAPTLLHDFQQMENAIGSRLPRITAAWLDRISDDTRCWWYQLAIERLYMDSFLQETLVAPVIRFLKTCDALEHQWTNILGGPNHIPTDSADTTSTRDELK